MLRWRLESQSIQQSTGNNFRKLNFRKYYGSIHRVVDQKIYLGLFAFLRDLETRRRALAGYFCEREEIDANFHSKSNKNRFQNPERKNSDIQAGGNACRKRKSRPRGGEYFE